MKIVEPGHVYQLPHLESKGSERLTFIKRSSGAVDYSDAEHPGTNTQEVLRALIDRTKFLNDVLPCLETQDAVYHLRMVLYLYEVRAYRRKQAKLNKKAGQHIDDIEPNAWRDGYDDVPFTEYEIEKLPTGPDGHVIFKLL